MVLYTSLGAAGSGTPLVRPFLATPSTAYLEFWKYTPVARSFSPTTSPSALVSVPSSSMLSTEPSVAPPPPGVVVARMVPDRLSVPEEFMVPV